VDLHIVGAEPTAEEREAVDTLLGAPESGWRGGPRSAEHDTRISRAGLESVRDLRDVLLPAFHAVQDRIGWISRGALNYICRRLIVPPAEAWGVVTFYHLFSTEPRPAIAVHVCDDIACRLQGANEICAQLESLSSSHGAEASPKSVWHFQRSPCLGQCDRAPAALIIRAGLDPSTTTVVGASSADEIVAHVDRVPSDASVTRVGETSLVATVGSRGDVKPPRLLRRIGKTSSPVSLASYREQGGYQALDRAITLGPERVIEEVIASGLLGRGGAAFPTGRKWEAVRRQAPRPHFLVCNADESEPGTFKDRVLLEEDPFALVEAMTITGFASGCEHGFIYIRGEYPLARARLQEAIDLARADGYLGSNVRGRSFAFDLEIRRGAGAYICGEETALFNSIEGKRGEPRSKPPFPTQVGLFGKPTVVNNVETLVNVIDIVLEGGDVWSRVGTKTSAGTRLFCVSGHVARAGMYEAEMGITVGDLIAAAGGVANGRSLQAVLLGGAAGTFVGPDAVSMPLTFEDARLAGTTLGSGVVMIFDDTADLGDTILRIARFMRDESCGQCVPCRVGTVRQVELLTRLTDPTAAREPTLATLIELGQAMRDASICGLGQTASSAIESALSRLQIYQHRGNGGNGDQSFS